MLTYARKLYIEPNRHMCVDKLESYVCIQARHSCPHLDNPNPHTAVVLANCPKGEHQKRELLQSKHTSRVTAINGNRPMKSEPAGTGRFKCTQRAVHAMVQTHQHSTTQPSHDKLQCVVTSQPRIMNTSFTIPDMHAYKSTHEGAAV
jgi:hypothetical protein